MKAGNSHTVLFIVYFGKWPDWTQLFLYSCLKNKSIQFILISDSNPCKSKIKNITYIKQTLDDVLLLIANKLELSLSISNPYKLCDFKPAYGLIFEDYIRDYKFWGFCDIDLIFGNLEEILLTEFKYEFDVLSGYTDFFSGPFALFRNKAEINNLFKSVINYKMIFTFSDYKGFDEHIIKEENKGFSLKKSFYLIAFILKKPAYLFNFRLLKFRFQWFYKRKTVNSPADFSEVLYKNSEKIKVKFSSLIVNYGHILRSNTFERQVSYKKGRLYNSQLKEISVFHFGSLKTYKTFKFNIRNIKEENCFIIDEKGINLCSG